MSWMKYNTKIVRHKQANRKKNISWHIIISSSTLIQKDIYEDKKANWGNSRLLISFQPKNHSSWLQPQIQRWYTTKHKYEQRAPKQGYQN